MRRIFLAAVAAGLLALCVCSASADDYAQEIPILAVGEDGTEYPSVTDGSYDRAELFPPGAVVNLAALEPEQKLYGLYLVWAAPPGNWLLLCDGVPRAHESNAYLHQYVPVEGGAQTVSVVLPDGEALCYVKAYTQGIPPEDVQIWQPPCRQADILLFPAHADDEILFFGGVLAEYAGQRHLSTQVVYFSEYHNVREHEKLDGLWACGVRSYPVSAPFPDIKPETAAQARRLFDVEQATAFLVEQLRRFRPQIVVGHDVNGEYGHETHKLTAEIIRIALVRSMDEDAYPESAQAYGVWDVPKAYLHLWQENPIHLNCRKPLPAFGGQTALEAAAYAYTKHVSQQWCWFYVSDENKYSIADFGLYRTTVGPDTQDDMMENLTSYEDQRRQERVRRAQQIMERLRNALAELTPPTARRSIPADPSLLGVSRNGVSSAARTVLGIVGSFRKAV